MSIPGKLRRSLDGRISRPLPSCYHPPMPQRKRDRIRTRRTWFHLGNDALVCWKVEIKGIQRCVNVLVRVWKCGKVKATYLDNGKWRRNSVKKCANFVSGNVIKWKLSWRKWISKAVKLWKSEWNVTDGTHLEEAKQYGILLGKSLQIITYFLR